jgi:Cd2+/Zn2+-exporting ATPase
MAFFGGIGGAASRGILFKGGNVFSKVATVDRVAFDKTGTITNGRFEISDVECFGIEKDELLSYVASTEWASNHPIAECLKSASEKIIPYNSVTEYAGEGLVAEFDDLCVSVGNTRLMTRVGVEVSETQSQGSRVFVAIGNRLGGIITISDEIKPEAVNTIGELRRLGVVRTYIFSGDREESVRRVADAVGVDEAHFSLTPEQKFNMLERTIASAKSTMYVGDGINDSPSLARADVGVAMGSMGQDSAIEAADLVIMTDNLEKLPTAVKIARKTIAISWQNIIFALGVKGLILILGLFGIANMWLAVFADVGVAVLAILNSMRALRAPK